MRVSQRPFHIGENDYAIEALSTGPFAITAHSFACSVLLASLARSFVRSPARSLTPDLMGKRFMFMNYMRRFHDISTQCAFSKALITTNCCNGEDPTEAPTLSRQPYFSNANKRNQNPTPWQTSKMSFGPGHIYHSDAHASAVNPSDGTNTQMGNKFLLQSGTRK